MTQAKGHEWSRGVRALSVLLAVLVWLSVTLERPGERKLTIPVEVERIPAGLKLAAQPPELQVVVSGPRIRLLFLPLSQPTCEINLTGAGLGEVSVAPTPGSFDLDPELKVVRVFPEWVNLTLVSSK